MAYKIKNTAAQAGVRVLQEPKALAGWGQRYPGPLQVEEFVGADYE